MTATSGDPVLVTGASGFLGRHVVAALAEAGWQVRALSRRPEKLVALGVPGVEVVTGDLLDPATVAGAMAGQKVVVHTAARVSDWGSRQTFWDTNVAGTAGVIAGCQASGIERLIHVSSLTVLGLPRDGRTVDESAVPPVLPRRDYYSATKLEAENLVRAAHGTSLATTVVRPGAIWGPGDPNVIPRLVRLLESGHMPRIGGGHNLLGLSHVTNLAAGIALAVAEPAARGQIYHLTDGEEITARQALTMLAEALDLTPPRRSLPYPVVLALAALVEGSARLMRRATAPRLTRYGVRFVACHCRYDTTKARRELGWRPVVSFADGIRELAAARG